MTDSFTLPTYQAPQPTPAVMPAVTPVAPVTPVTPPAVAPIPAAPSTAPQISATDRLEALLKQLQDEQVSTAVTPVSAPAVTPPAAATPVVAPVTAAAPVATPATPAGQDFAAALSRMPVTPRSETPAPSTNSLDSVIKTVGEQFEMGQPSLAELLKLAKEAKTQPASEVISAAPSPMQVVKPPQDWAPNSMTATAAAPKITVMPAATSEPALATEEAPVAAPRVLSSYLQNLTQHFEQHGQLQLSNYTKLATTR